MLRFLGLILVGVVLMYAVLVVWTYVAAVLPAPF